MTIKLIPIPASYLRRNTCVKASAILAIQIATTIVCSGFLFGDDSKQSDEYFERRVRPILAERCFECHSSDSEKIHGGLRVDHVSLMLKGGDSGPAIVSGDAGESLLVKAIKYDGYEMPPNSRLPDAEVEVLRDWIAGGAHWPKEAVPERKAAKPPFDLKKRMDEHWVWRPIVAPKTPKQIANLASNNPVDRFIDAALAEANITPNGSIDRAVLIRRLYFDLIGLPPTLDELNEWLECKDENWTEQLVDRLLANPQFGVRWGRHWLDLVRFANSRGHEFDEDIPVADEYRDYVVRALNSDLPYDEFVREHIAGDLIQPPRTSNDGRINESVIATGYWHLGEWVHSPVDSRKDETDRFDNMIDVFSKTFLGLTVACARCHDHKFDAISTEDYYALYGFLKSSDYRLIRYETDIEHRKVANQLEAIRVRSNQELRNTIWAAIEAESKPPVSVGKELQPSERSVTASLKSALAETRSKLADKPLATPLPIEDNRVKFDVRNTDLRLWNSDGVVFGNRPNRAGELLLSRSGDPNEFRVAIQDEGARDSFWNRITNSHRVVNQQNKFAQLNEAGKLLPTPAFELTADQISYLVRGSVRAFVSVDSLRMIAGPLHGETVLDSSGSADEYRWVTQSLSRYRDRTIHIEFAPMDDKPCGIVQVVLGSPPLSNRLISNDSDTDEEIIWKDFDALIHQDASSDISRSQNAVLIHAFSEWFRVRRQTLGDSHPLNVAIDQISERWRAEEDALSEKVEWNSRLALSMRDGTGQDDRVLIRGNPARPGDRAPRRSLTALGGCEAPMTGPGSGRQEWAKHITAPESPLLARVMANRVWHHLLGRGIVPTTAVFELQPTTN